MEEDDVGNNGFIPVGNWDDGFGGGYDIDKTSVRYYTADFGPEYPPTELKGDIVTAVDFSGTSGVLIIKITDQTGAGYTVNNYTGVYYKEYTAAHVLLANAINASYAPIEASSLDAAKSIFTAGNMGTHVQMWGNGYTPK
jgi:hypothetical protein